MERQRWEESEKSKRKKKEDAGPKVEKSRICVFPMICGSRGSKSRLAKAASAEPCGQMRDEKLRAFLVPSTFRRQKGKNTSHPGHSWLLRCGKSAWRCIAKHILKSKW